MIQNVIWTQKVGTQKPQWYARNMTNTADHQPGKRSICIKKNIFIDLCTTTNKLASGLTYRSTMHD